MLLALTISITLGIYIFRKFKNKTLKSKLNQYRKSEFIISEDKIFLKEVRSLTTETRNINYKAIKEIHYQQNKVQRKKGLGSIFILHTSSPNVKIDQYNGLMDIANAKLVYDSIVRLCRVHNPSFITKETFSKFNA
jgi:hypothetical protein